MFSWMKNLMGRTIAGTESDDDIIQPLNHDPAQPTLFSLGIKSTRHEEDITKSVKEAKNN